MHAASGLGLTRLWGLAWLSQIDIWLLHSWLVGAYVELQGAAHCAPPHTCEVRIVTGCQDQSEAIQWLCNLLARWSPTTKPTELFSNNKSTIQCNKMPCISCLLKTHWYSASFICVIDPSSNYQSHWIPSVDMIVIFSPKHYLILLCMKNWPDTFALHPRNP